MGNEENVFVFLKQNLLAGIWLGSTIIFIGDVVFIVEATLIFGCLQFWDVGQRYLIIFLGGLKKLGRREVKKLGVDLFYRGRDEKKICGG